MNEYITSRSTVILLALAVWMFSPLLYAYEFPDVVDRIRPSVVGVGTAYPPRQPNRKGDPSSYRGTGFVVGNGNQAITNAHVIPEKLDRENNEELVIFIGRGARSQARLVRVVRWDKRHDLVLLAFDGSPLPALVLGDSSRVREGQEIAFTGFPIGMVLGLYPVTHRGIIAAIIPMARPMENVRNLSPAQLSHLRDNMFDAFQLDAVAYPGNSGSPVYNTVSGEVLGVVNSTLVKESKESMLERPSGISYAIPASYIKALLAPG